MKFGINFFPAFRESDSTTPAYYEQCLHLAERADVLGYNSVKTVEHSFFDYGGRSPNPCLLLSAVAARTKRIRVITGAVIPAFHHPVHLGAELAMLDNLSNGRLDAGFGRAFLPKEFEVYGATMEESRAKLEESIGVIRRMWTEERVSHKGKFWSFEDVRLMPRVVQKPHPPVWIAAITTEESFVYAAKNGFNVMIVPYAGKPGLLPELVKLYRKIWKESGHPAGKDLVQVSMFLSIDEDGAEAHRRFARILGRYTECFGEAVADWKKTTSEQYPGYEKLIAAITNTTPESVIKGGGGYVGTPDEVTAQLQATVDTFGTNIEPSMQINFGGATTEESLKSLELFAARVMPKF
jgi:alkanesulfonate monooxygenase SsuD/methylene tetrahydromethanopterin reductase-like flavin-dependent oxidoreductase (luciferase family)